MTTKKDIIFLGNERIQNRIDLDKWTPVIEEYVRNNTKSNSSKVLSQFVTLPDQMKIEIVDFLIEYYAKKFQITLLCNKQSEQEKVFNINKPIRYYA